MQITLKELRKKIAGLSDNTVIELSTYQDGSAVVWLGDGEALLTEKAMDMSDYE